MFFLVRSAFWLGLVYTAMDWPGDGRLNDDLKAAARPVAAQALTAATQKVEKTCISNLAACVDGAARINKLTVDAADMAKPKPAPAHQPPPRKISADSLTPTDLSPAWRGAPKTRTASAAHP